ncbi:MAG: hypothetical protein CME62_14600 [Halobacteriovoraceae bacterium]|nr:hypothetical protein [Halobacteriovoraceae bacterium]|tara:strand:- start:10847 stop:11377 length:531 start_codon:yes stop_codon:yes gene_type:complete
MKYSIQEISLGLLKTILLLLVLEIVTTAVLPMFDITSFKPNFNILIVLFLAFKLNTPLLAFIILIVQYVHSAFSIEGWAMGTFTGVFISVLVQYIKDQLNFSSAASTIIVVQIFQLIWIVIGTVMLCFKMEDFSSFLTLMWHHVPESIFLSILSPFFFRLLDGFWHVNRRSSGVAY